MIANPTYLTNPLMSRYRPIQYEYCMYRNVIVGASASDVTLGPSQ